MKKISIGIIGFGEYSKSYLELWFNHPLVEKVVGAEMIASRREEISSTYGIKMYTTEDEMYQNEPDMTCVAIFTQRHQHAAMAIRALNMGKHVFSAVPMGISEEEIREILDIVKKTRLIYMMAETCYYFPCAIWCREQYKQGRFGNIVYGAAQYYHDVDDMFGSFASLGDSWKKFAGIPPMYYATHSMSMLFSAVDDYPVNVTCFGYKDVTGDDIYGEGKNNWDNPFSNEVAILRLSRGGIARINEFRRIGNVRPTSYISGIYGEEGTYEYSGNQHLFSRNVCRNREFTSTDVSDEVNTYSFIHDKNLPEMATGVGKTDYKYQAGFSPVNDLSRLPKNYINIHEFSHEPTSIVGHNGSHMFLVDDFVRAVVTGKLPPVTPWMSAIYTLAGIYAHESAMKGGVTLELPDVGKVPADWEIIDYNDIKY